MLQILNIQHLYIACKPDQFKYDQQLLQQQRLQYAGLGIAGLTATMIPNTRLSYAIVHGRDTARLMMQQVWHA